MRTAVWCSFALMASCGSAAVDRAMDAATLDYDLCRIDRGGNASGQSNDICARIARRWLLLTDAVAPPGVIRVVNSSLRQNTSTDSSWTFQAEPPHPAGYDRSAVREQDGYLRSYAEDFLPHEIGHGFISSFVGVREAPGDTDTHYGSSAPDWIDEGAAVWMESQSTRTWRMRDATDSTPSLRTLTTMPHPELHRIATELVHATYRLVNRTVLPPCGDTCTWFPDSVRHKYEVSEIRVNPDASVDTVLWHADADPRNNDTYEKRNFYPLSYSLIRFIHVRGGPAAIRALADRVRADPTPRPEILVGLPGLPGSVDAVERAWHAFLKNLPPEDQ